MRKPTVFERRAFQPVDFKIVAVFVDFEVCQSIAEVLDQV